MALRVGVVGVRGIGTKHSQCYHDDDLAELVAVCDIVKERADTAADKFGVKKYYTLTDMLKNEDLDIVDVSTGGYENGGWHYEPVMEALEAGKHTIVEKPLSNEVTQAREMVAKAAEKKVYLACNLNHYFTPPAEKAREYMDNGEVGELIYCIHKMGFPGGERTYGGPATDFRHAGFPYFPALYLTWCRFGRSRNQFRVILFISASASSGTLERSTGGTPMTRSR